MKNLIKIFLTLTVVLSSSFALQKDEIKSQMNSKIDKVLVVLSQKTLTNQQKGDKIITIIDDVFDYELMGKLALGGKTWKSISTSQQKEFIKVFEKKLKESYISKLKLYNNQKMNIVDLVPYKKTRLQLKSELIGEDKTYEINYNFYENKSDSQWYIYDVDLAGVSIIKTYKEQFRGLLKEQTFDEMLQTLKNSINKA